MPDPELREMLKEMRDDIKSVLKAQAGTSEWQRLHERSDDAHFNNLGVKLDGMSRYGASIAMVAGFVGACSTWIWNRITNS